MKKMRRETSAVKAAANESASNDNSLYNCRLYLSWFAEEFPKEFECAMNWFDGMPGYIDPNGDDGK